MSRRTLRTLLALTLFTIAAGLVTGLLTPTTFGDLGGTGFSRPILALEFVRSAESFTSIVATSAAGFRRATLADLVFIAAYGALWACMLFMASGQKRALVRRLGLLFLVLAVLADVIEDWAILAGLGGGAVRADIIFTAAAVKWVALGLAWLTLVERVLTTDCGSHPVVKGCGWIAAAGYGLAGAIALAGTALVLSIERGVVLEYVALPLFVSLPLQAGLVAWAVWTRVPDPFPPPEALLKAGPHPLFTDSLDAVRLKEIDYVTRRRRTAGEPDPVCADVSNTLVGLALSGGGIRSATTNLGILQALSRMGLLSKVDYLSTVSGGGYIGACLSSLLSCRRGTFSDDQSQVPESSPRSRYEYRDRSELRFTTEWRQFPFNPDLPRAAGDCCEPQSPDSVGKRIVAHLRTHGNFLIARTGLLKRDALRAVGHLLTGVVYHLTATLAALFVAALVMMGMAHQLEPDLAKALQVPATVAPTDVANVVPLTGTGAGYKVSRPGRPSLVDAVWSRLETVVLDAVGHALDGPLRRSLFTGAGASLLVFAIFMVGAWLPSWPSTWKAGENQEDAFHRVLLRMAMFVLIAAGSSCAFIARVGADQHAGSLAAPFLVLMAARITGFALYVLVTRAETQKPAWQIFNLWTRKFRSLWGSYQAMCTYGMVITAVFGLIPILAYASVDVSPWGAVTPAVSLVLSRLLVSQPAASGARRLRVPPSVIRALLGLGVGVFVIVSLVVVGALGVRFGFADPADGFAFAIALGAGLVLLVVLGLFGDVNRISPHYFYRDRLLETYLRIETPRADKAMETFSDASGIKLREMHGKDPAPPEPGNTAPYLLISAAINLPGSRDLTRKDRKSGYFLFSKYYCGSRHTGYRATDWWRDGDTKLSRAMTISGAAVSTAMGSNTFFGESFVLAVFNVRLGYWMTNPRFNRNDSFVFWPRYLLQEIFGKANERASLVNLSDGGHTGDNVGIYPLLERRCQVIIACDAEADGGLSFGSFTEALRHAYVDLGVTVDINLGLIRPDPVTGLSKSHCAVGRVKYPECTDRPNWIIYLKNSLTGDEPAPVTNYRASNPAFPHESTIDQFFDDAQFESYRALGVHIAEDALASWAADPAVALALGRPQA